MLKYTINLYALFYDVINYPYLTNRNFEKISKKSKESKLILILEAYKTAKKKSGFDSFH